MDSFSNFELLAACFRRIDIEDISPQHIYSHISSPYLSVHRDITYERFRVPNECIVFNICSKDFSQQDLLRHWFVFQSPACPHVHLRFLDRPVEHYIFGETELLRTSPDIRLGCLYVLTKAKEFFYQYSASLLEPVRLCFAAIKLYSWEHGSNTVIKITARIRCTKRGSTIEPDTELGTTVSWTLYTLCSHQLFRRDALRQFWDHLLYSVGRRL